MLNCTLSKNNNYEVRNIFFNSADKSYQLTLAEKTAKCEAGIFTSKKLVLKIVPDNKTPFLHFNKQAGAPELILNDLSLIKQGSISTTTTTHSNSISDANRATQQSSAPNYSFLYIILAVIAVVLVIRFFLKKKNENSPYYPANNNFNYDPNNPNNPNNFNNNNPNNGPMNQGPSRTGSFMSGLAGGALGSVVGNALYDKFRDHNNPSSTNSNDSSFSSDNSFNSGNDSFDDSSDTFSSDD